MLGWFLAAIGVLPNSMYSTVYWRSRCDDVSRADDGKGGYAREEFNVRCSLVPVAVRCVLLCELSADGCGKPANWVAEWRGEELDSGNAMRNV